MKPKSFIILTISLTLLILTLVFFNSCTRRTPTYTESKSEDAIYGWNYLDETTRYRVANIDGHQYLVFKVKEFSYGSSPICVIHSESCPCKKKK